MTNEKGDDSHTRIIEIVILHYVLGLSIHRIYVVSCYFMSLKPMNLKW